MKNLKRFNKNLGGWVSGWDGSYTDKVEVIDKNQYTLELENTNKVTIFVNGGMLYYGTLTTESEYKYGDPNPEFEITVPCDFLGSFIAKGIVSMLKINTGWFSSIQVSHDALVCLDDLNIPLNSKSDWEKALARKQEVRHYWKTGETEEERIKQAERKREAPKRERQAKENDITNNNIRKRFVNGDITLEKSIEEQTNFNKRIAQEAQEEEKRKKEIERRIKILDDNKITDETIRDSFIYDRYDIKGAISEQERLNKQESHKTEMQEIIESYKFDSSQTYVLSMVPPIDLYTVSKKDLIDRCNRTKNLGIHICKAIQDSRVVQGMKKEVVLLSMGKPADIDETVYKTKIKAYYFYHPYKTRQNKTRHKFRVDLENDIVVGWKDLD